MSVLFLHSAHCGYDAIKIAEAQGILTEGNRRSAAIDLDGGEERIAGQIEAFVKDLENERSRRSLEGCETLTPAQAIGFLVESYQEENMRLTMRKRFSDLPHSFCNTVSVLFDDSFRSLAGNPQLTEIHLPAICKGCLTDSLSALLSRNLGRDITVRWDDRWDVSADAADAGYIPLSAFTQFKGAFSDVMANRPPLERPAAPKGSVPLIGLVGNPLLCFNASLTKMLTDLIHEYGGEVALPDPDDFQYDEGGYRRQLDAYSDRGVDGVICLQDAYCLKEHVDVRGSLQSLQRRYPAMPLIAIEFDSGLSPIELLNRVSLAIGRAFDKHWEGARSA